MCAEPGASSKWVCELSLHILERGVCLWAQKTWWLQILALSFPGWVVLGKGLPSLGPVFFFFFFFFGGGARFLICQMNLGLVPERRKRALLFDVKPSA